jgi:polysaccharide export outer membrane protein
MASWPRLGRAFALSAFLGGPLLFMGCVAPGMKLDVKSTNEPTTTEMGGLQVTLHKLDPQAIPAQTQLPLDSAALAELTSDPPKPYTIGPQDVLLVTVWDHPEITAALSQFRTDNATGSLVDDNGNIYFPYVGQIQMSGLTAPQARAKITAELAKVLQKPQVDLKVISFRSQKVFVGGEVKTPAIYNITDVPFTLSEAVNRAGGFTPIADDSRMVLTRGARSWNLNFRTLMTQGNTAGKIRLKDGDSLLVPSVQENPIYMMGEVAKPGTVPLARGSLSLARALSDSGGLLGTSADARSIYVIRKGEGAKDVDVFHLDSRNPTAMVLADQFALRPRDIVYVDAGTTVRFSRVMALILPTVYAVTGTVIAAND